MQRVYGASLRLPASALLHVYCTIKSRLAVWAKRLRVPFPGPTFQKACHPARVPVPSTTSRSTARGAGLCGVAGEDVGAGQAEMGQCAQVEVQHEASVVEQLLEFDSGGGSAVC